MTTSHRHLRHSKRPLPPLSSPSSSGSESDNNDDRPSKRLAKSLNRLSLSSTPIPEPHDIEMRQRKSYEKDPYTVVIESLSTTSSDADDEDDKKHEESDAPFSRDENHVTILSEIEKRLSRFPHKLLSPSTPDTALVLYRSPESMGLPKLERQKQEEAKAEMRRRIAERRRLEAQARNPPDLDGYEADVEDWGSHNHVNRTNGIHEMSDENEDEDDGEMMDLD